MIDPIRREVEAAAADLIELGLLEEDVAEMIACGGGTLPEAVIREEFKEPINRLRWAVQRLSRAEASAGRRRPLGKIG
jgi:hypothetical protein